LGNTVRAKWENEIELEKLELF